MLFVLFSWSLALTQKRLFALLVIESFVTSSQKGLFHLPKTRRFQRTLHFSKNSPPPQEISHKSNHAAKTRVYLSIYIYIYTYIYTYVYVYMYICIMYIYIYMYINIFKYINMYAYIYIYVYIYIYTHLLLPAPSCWSRHSKYPSNFQICEFLS